VKGGSKKTSHPPAPATLTRWTYRALIETLNLPFSLIAPTARRCSSTEKNLCVLSIAPHDAKFYRDGIEDIFVSTGMIINKGVGARDIFANGARMIAFNTCYIAMLVLADKTPVVCQYF
jgi:hypothetical protein